MSNYSAISGNFANFNPTTSSPNASSGSVGDSASTNSTTKPIPPVLPKGTQAASNTMYNPQASQTGGLNSKNIFNEEISKDELTPNDLAKLQSEILGNSKLLNSIDPEELTATYTASYNAAQAGESDKRAYQLFDNEVNRLVANYTKVPTQSNFEALTFATAAIYMYAEGLNLLLKQTAGTKEITNQLSDLLGANSAYNGDLSAAMNALAKALQQKNISDVLASLKDSMSNLQSAIDTYNQQNSDQSHSSWIFGGLQILIGGLVALIPGAQLLGATIAIGGLATIAVGIGRYYATDAKINTLQKEVSSLATKYAHISQDGLVNELQELGQILNNHVATFNAAIQNIQKVCAGVELVINIALTVYSLGAASGLKAALQGLSTGAQIIRMTAIAAFVVIPTIGNLVGGAAAFIGQLNENQSWENFGNKLSTYSSIGGIVGSFIPTDTLIGQIVQAVVSMGLNIGSGLGVAHWIAGKGATLPAEISEPINSLRATSENITGLERQVKTVPEAQRQAIMEKISEQKNDLARQKRQITDNLTRMQEEIAELKEQARNAHGEEKSQLKEQVAAKEAIFAQARYSFQAITGNRIIVSEDGVVEAQSATTKLMRTIQALLEKLQKTLNSDDMAKVMRRLNQGQTVMAYLNFAVEQAGQMAQNFASIVSIMNTAVSSSIHFADARVRNTNAQHEASVRNTQNAMNQANTSMQQINSAITAIATAATQDAKQIMKALDQMMKTVAHLQG